MIFFIFVMFSMEIWVVQMEKHISCQNHLTRICGLASGNPEWPSCGSGQSCTGARSSTVSRSNLVELGGGSSAVELESIQKPQPGLSCIWPLCNSCIFLAGFNQACKTPKSLPCCNRIMNIMNWKVHIAVSSCLVCKGGVKSLSTLVHLQLYQEVSCTILNLKASNFFCQKRGSDVFVWRKRKAHHLSN